MIVVVFVMSILLLLVWLVDVGFYVSVFWWVFLVLLVLWFWMIQEECQRLDVLCVWFLFVIIFVGFVFIGDLFFWYFMVMYMSIVNGMFFVMMVLFWVVIFGWLLLCQWVSCMMLVGLGFCFVGGVVLVVESFVFNLVYVLGDVMGIVIGVFFGFYFFCVGVVWLKSGVVCVIFEMSLIMVVFFFVVVYVMELYILLKSGYGWGIFLIFVFVSYVGGQGLFFIVFGWLLIVFFLLVIFLEVIVVVIIVWVLFNELVLLLQVVGGMIILVGIWVVWLKLV